MAADSGLHAKAPLVHISRVAPSTESSAESISATEPNHLSNVKIDRAFQTRGSILSSELSILIEKVKPNIPDGGWGWFVVLACFVINMISDGVSFVFGHLLIEFANEFESSKSATSWIGSLFMSLPLIAGPIASALVDKYGCRSMTILGGLICTVGLTSSAYVRSLGSLYLTFGVIGGLGMSLCFVTAVVSIAFWFEKKRTIALGLAASGTGFGTAAFSPLATWFLYLYGWRGTLLVIAAVFANMCVCGVLMRDPDWLVDEENREKLKKRRSSSGSSGTSLRMEELKAILKRGGDTPYFLEHVDASLDLSDKDRFRSTINLPTFVKESEEVPLEVLKQLSENKQLYNVILENYPNLLASSSSEKGSIRGPIEHSMSSPRLPVKNAVKLKKPEEPILEEVKDRLEVPAVSDCVADSHANRIGRTLLRSLSHKARHQIQTHTYLKNIRFRKNSIGYRGAMLNIHRYRMRASSCPDFFKNSMTSIDEEKWYQDFLDILKDLTNFSLFLDLHFLLFSVSTIILFIWCIVPYFFLADQMKGNGYDESQSSFVISVIGITNTIGMVVLGWAGGKVNVAMSYAICLILCGISVGTMLFFTSDFVLLTVCSGCFGLFFASCLSLTPSLLAELVSLDDFTMAYGLILLCQGIGNLTGPPLAGLLFDLTQSYEQSFYQAAFWIVVSGVLIGFIPFTTNRQLLANKKTDKYFLP